MRTEYLKVTDESTNTTHHQIQVRTASGRWIHPRKFPTLEDAQAFTGSMLYREWLGTMGLARPRTTPY